MDDWLTVPLTPHGLLLSACVASSKWLRHLAPPWSMHSCWEWRAGSAYLGRESAWEPGKRLEWRTSHLTGYGMESSGHSQALEHAGSGPRRENRH